MDLMLTQPRWAQVTRKEYPQAVPGETTVLEDDEWVVDSVHCSVVNLRLVGTAEPEVRVCERCKGSGEVTGRCQCVLCGGMRWCGACNATGKLRIRS